MILEKCPFFPCMENVTTVYSFRPNDNNLLLTLTDSGVFLLMAYVHTVSNDIKVAASIAIGINAEGNKASGLTINGTKTATNIAKPPILRRKPKLKNCRMRFTAL